MLPQIPNKFPRIADCLSHHIDVLETVTVKQISAWVGCHDDTVRNWRDGATMPDADDVAAIGRHRQCPEALRRDLAETILRGWGLRVEAADGAECDEPPLSAGLEGGEKHAGWLRKLCRYLRDNWLSRAELADVLSDLRWLRCYLDRMEAKLLRRARQTA